jgi:trigger factor
MSTGEEEYLKEVTSPTGLKRVLVFEVPRERVEKEIHDIITGIRKEVALPGFRKGKAPLDLVRARFGETAEKEAIEKLIPEAYRKALEKESLQPIMPAEMSDMTFGREGPLSFQIAIEIAPTVEIGEYKGLKAKREKKEVGDDDVDREIDSLKQRLTSFEKLDRESRQGDVVVADYWRVGEDGKMVRGSRVSNYPFELGAEGMFKEFNEGLAGLKKGDKTTVKVTYPEDFSQEDLRGTSVEFGIEVKEIGEKKVPEVDEEFAEKMGLESVESLKAKIREQLTEAAEAEALSKLKRSLLDTVIQESSFEVPEGLVSRALEALSRSYREEYERSGDDPAAEKLREIEEKLRPLAVNVVKEEFILVDIAKRENIVVEDSEIETILTSIAERSGTPVAEVRKRAAESDEIGRWRRDIIKRKVLDLLFENAKIEE